MDNWQLGSQPLGKRSASSHCGANFQVYPSSGANVPAKSRPYIPTASRTKLNATFQSTPPNAPDTPAKRPAMQGMMGLALTDLLYYQFHPRNVYYDYIVISKQDQASFV